MGKKKKSVLRTIIPFVLNKYVISLMAVIVWIVFFDTDNLLSQFQLTQKLHALQQEQRYYKNEIEKNKNYINELRTNATNLEKFAREKYLMKKENEEIFVIVKDSTKEIKSVNPVSPS